MFVRLIPLLAFAHIMALASFCESTDHKKVLVYDTIINNNTSVPLYYQWLDGKQGYFKIAPSYKYAMPRAITSNEGKNYTYTIILNDTHAVLSIFKNTKEIVTQSFDLSCLSVSKIKCSILFPCVLTITIKDIGNAISIVLNNNDNTKNASMLIV